MGLLQHTALGAHRITISPKLALRQLYDSGRVGEQPNQESAASWATLPGVRKSMQANRPRDTVGEASLRSALHRVGLRFRKHYRPLPFLRCEADVAFPKLRLAVFFDGCFWHGCPDHGTRPVAHGDWWGRKLDNNKVRDEQNAERLREAGWTVVRVWEHENEQEAVAKIKAAVSSLQSPTLNG